jgi:hypothetical protein
MVVVAGVVVGEAGARSAADGVAEEGPASVGKE